jgi:DNA polymerase-4
MSDQVIRKIIHVDMDAFYASVEQRDNPELRNKPVAVGGSRKRGVVAAASYEARRYGVRSAMPSVTALRRCPNLIFVKHRFDAYKEASSIIRSIFLEYTDLVEPLSLDEAFLDVSTNKMNMPSATLIAKEIKQRINEATGLNASACISINKFFDKTASDMDKPNGLTLIKPEEAEATIAKMKIEKFHGIGKVTAKRMKNMGIYTGLELKSKSIEFLTAQFGKSGKYFYNISRAIDNRPVNPNRIRKSISLENTFEIDLEGKNEIESAIDNLIPGLLERVRKANTTGRTITLKMKFDDFTQMTRSKTSQVSINTDNIENILSEITSQIDFNFKPVRLLGLGISNLDNDLDDKSVQLTLTF